MTDGYSRYRTLSYDAPIPFPEHAWPLFRKALEHIAQHPDEFYMKFFTVVRGKDHPNLMGQVETRTQLPFPQCGTAACLAGHISMAAGHDPSVESVSASMALEDLGLGDTGGGNQVVNRLVDIFGLVNLRTYSELRDVLMGAFTFPEPLPEPAL